MESTDSSSISLTMGPLNETLDARVYQSPTKLMPPSPPSVPAGARFSSNLISGPALGILSGARPFYENKYENFISKYDDKNVPHLPSKYATTYELEKFKKNAMIIFNHNKFESAAPRLGTEKDEENLRQVFESYKFEVNTHRDLTKRNVIETIREFAQTDFSECGCICVAILTHGGSRAGYLEAYDRRYREIEIFKPFDASRNPTLVAKPIIFIIQACRGARASVRVDTKRETRLQLDIGEDKGEYHLPTEADRIVFHSSYMGRASVRHPERGSWFIQALCSKLKDCGHKDHLETIFTLVKREVALDYVNTKNWKQMPVVTSTLLRELYLVPMGQDTPAESNVDVEMHSDGELHQHLDNPKETVSMKDLDESPDSSLTTLRPVQMPCSCFLEYFEYLKKCLVCFVHHNPKDTVAVSLLSMMQRLENGAEYNLQKFSFIRDVWEYFNANMDKFPGESAKFVYRKYYST